MEHETSFSYRYSALKNEEIQKIRKKYLLKEENKVDELKRLDRYVQSAGQLPALTLGILGCLTFGFGMCLAMKIIGESLLLGIPFGTIGAVCMSIAYPIYRTSLKRAKEKFAPRILQLSSELIGEKN